MITNKSSVSSFSFLSKFEPFLALLQNFSFLKIEVSSDNSFKSFGWVLQILNHRKLNVTISDNIRVSLVFLFSFNCALFMLETGFIKVNLFSHDDTLNGN